MVARCLEFDKQFGFLFHSDDVHGPFRIQPGRVGCVAEISDFQPLPDGRSLMMTRGVERFHIVTGVEPSAQYYEAIVEPFGDRADDEDEAELIRHRQRTVGLFRELLRTLPDVDETELDLDTRAETSFQVAATIQVDPVWQQGLLELRHESQRLDRIDQLLRGALESRRGLEGPNNPSVN